MRTIALLLMLVSTATNAQSARELFEQANAATQDGRFADARDLYRESLALERNRGNAFNLAVALTLTGEFVEAERLFDALLEGTYDPLAPAQRRQVTRLRQEAADNVATLVIQLPRVAGLEVRIDGQRRSGEVRLDPGEHIVTVTSPRHRPIEEELRVRRGERLEFQPTLQLRADLTMGRLIVEAPEGGHLSVAGVAEAIGRLELRLEAGIYEVALESDGRERTREVLVEAGATSRYEIALAPPRRPWLWVLGGAVLVGTLTTALVLTRTEQRPRSDDVYGTISTLRF